VLRPWPARRSADIYATNVSEDELSGGNASPRPLKTLATRRARNSAISAQVNE